MDAKNEPVVTRSMSWDAAQPCPRFTRVHRFERLAQPRRGGDVLQLIRPQAGAHAQDLYQQAVVLKLMPMNNATGITDAERAALGRWYEAGAPGAPAR